MLAGFAVDRDNVEVVRLLLSYGASPLASYTAGALDATTPLNYARATNRDAVVAAMESHLALQASAPPPRPAQLSVTEIVQSRSAADLVATGLAAVADAPRKSEHMAVSGGGDGDERVLDGKGTRRPGNHWSSSDLRVLAESLRDFCEGTRKFDLDFIYKRMPVHSKVTLTRHLNACK